MYIALIAGSIVTAGAVLFTRSRAALLGAAGLAASAAVGYVLSRTTGLPNATGDIRNWTEPLGLPSLFVEGAVTAAALGAHATVAKPVRRAAPVTELRRREAAARLTPLPEGTGQGAAAGRAYPSARARGASSASPPRRGRALARARPRLDQALAGGCPRGARGARRPRRDRGRAALIFTASGSVALLADLIHNVGDALTAVPLGVAFLVRSDRAERGAASSSSRRSSSRPAWPASRRCPASSIRRADPPLGARRAGVADTPGTCSRRWSAPARAAGSTARARRRRQPRPRRRLRVPRRGRASAGRGAAGVTVADPLIGLAITLVILRITVQSWRTVRGVHDHHHHG